MKTIVEVRLGRDFSDRNLGTISLEPPIHFPANTLAAYRLKVGFDVSKHNLAGPWGELSQHNAPGPLFDAVSSTSQGSDGFLAASEHVPAGSVTICGVVWCEAGGQSRLVGGSFSGVGSYNFSVLLHNSGVVRVVAVDIEHPTVSADIPFDSGRWEFVAGIRDVDTGNVSAYIPRTGSKVDVEGVGAAGVSQGVARVGGSATGNVSGALRAALVSFHETAMSVQEIDDYYLSVKESLLASGIGL